MHNGRVVGKQTVVAVCGVVDALGGGDHGALPVVDVKGPCRGADPNGLLALHDARTLWESDGPEILEDGLPYEAVSDNAFAADTPP